MGKNIFTRKPTSKPKPRAKISSMVVLLPNLLTTCNLFWGYYAIIASLRGDYVMAVYAIFLAAIFDTLDGQVAKLTKTHSAFGVQLDSLSDLVSFGVAPAFLAFQYSLGTLDRVGWIVCFIFLACGALRLARFNVHSFHSQTSSQDFVGLPIPAAAIFIASYVLFLHDLRLDELQLQIWRDALQFITAKQTTTITLIVMTLTASVMMVSSVAYRSHKSIDIKTVKPFKVLVLLILALAVIAYRPKFWAFALATAYTLSGVLEWLLGWKRLAADDDIYPLQDNPNDGG
ncbi:MAG: CDP-diacylglycerol--serine O-phosphatidyltransferase [Pseudomonadota bacterium]|nr:CDP-diacylglycerol--serine O-phosphatidyltransferase [Pseudomonadota bacterium]